MAVVCRITWETPAGSVASEPLMLSHKIFLKIHILLVALAVAVAAFIDLKIQISQFIVDRFLFP